MDDDLDSIIDILNENSHQQQKSLKTNGLILQPIDQNLLQNQQNLQSQNSSQLNFANVQQISTQQQQSQNQRAFSLPPLVKRLPSAQRQKVQFNDGKLQAQADFEAINELVKKRKEQELIKFQNKKFQASIKSSNSLVKLNSGNPNKMNKDHDNFGNDMFQNGSIHEYKLSVNRQMSAEPHFSNQINDKEEQKVGNDQKENQILLSKIDEAYEYRQNQPPASQCKFSKKYMLFRPYIDPMSIRPYKPPDKNLYFKFYKGTDLRLIRYTFEDNGFREASDRKQDWSVMWASSTIQSQTYQALTKFQKVNHWPKTTEITRKDCLYKNFARMREKYSQKHFSFVPMSFILPHEQAELQEAMQNNPQKYYICKPSASSQGKGIFITNSFQDVSQLKQSTIVCEYIDNPLLLDGYKFDLRIYVALTCVNPLRIYVYEEGLVRLATVKYTSAISSLKHNQYTHLTNYSLNKHNAAFQENQDAQQDDQGSKQSITAFRRKLKAMGHDDNLLFAKIDDIIIKSIVSVEHIINNAVDMFVPYKNTNCFELFGFDILIDQDITPWLLEVNLCPALSCDSPLDQKVKSNCIADLFSLAGVIKIEHRNTTDINLKKYQMAYGGGPNDQLSQLMNKRKPLPNNSQQNNAQQISGNIIQDIYQKAMICPPQMPLSQIPYFSKEEKQIIKETEDEFKRRGFFKRIFPSHNFLYYKQFFEEERLINYIIDARIFAKKRNINPMQIRKHQPVPIFASGEINNVQPSFGTQQS